MKTIDFKNSVSNAFLVCTSTPGYEEMLVWFDEPPVRKHPLFNDTPRIWGAPRFNDEDFGVIALQTKQEEQPPKLKQEGCDAYGVMLNGPVDSEFTTFNGLTKKWEEPPIETRDTALGKLEIPAPAPKTALELRLELRKLIGRR